ncbi:hypothetical protein ACLOJK_036758, partial [Asimina triloba]
ISDLQTASSRPSFQMAISGSPSDETKQRLAISRTSSTIRPLAAADFCTSGRSSVRSGVDVDRSTNPLNQAAPKSAPHLGHGNTRSTVATDPRLAMIEQHRWPTYLDRMTSAPTRTCASNPSRRQHRSKDDRSPRQLHPHPTMAPTSISPTGDPEQAASGHKQAPNWLHLVSSVSPTNPCCSETRRDATSSIQHASRDERSQPFKQQEFQFQ